MDMKRKKVMKGIFALALICGISQLAYAADNNASETQPISIQENELKNGEEYENGYWFYYEDGVKLKNTFKELDDGRIVYYGSDGNMQYGECRIEGYWFYFDTKNGAMQTGFVNLSGKTVYYDENTGYMLYGSQTINGRNYYFNENSGCNAKGYHTLNDGSKVGYGADGSMQYGEAYINNKWYYFDETTGIMQTGFVNLKNKTVYYGTDGSMQYGEVYINGKWYHFDELIRGNDYGNDCVGKKKQSTMMKIVEQCNMVLLK